MSEEETFKNLEDQFLTDLPSIFLLTDVGHVASSQDDQHRMNQSLQKFEKLFEKYRVDFRRVSGDGRSTGRATASQMYHNSLILQSQILRHRETGELSRAVESLLEANQVLQRENERLQRRNEQLEEFVSEMTDRFNRFSIGSSSTDVELEEEQEQEQQEEEREEQRE